jgi:hypothetical protein
MAEGLAEDAAKYIEVGRYCGFPNEPKAAALLALLAEVEPKATMAGAVHGELLFRGAKSSFPKASLCQTLAPGRPKYAADLSRTYDTLAGLTGTLAPVKGTGDGPLSGLSNGDDFLRAATAERRRWVDLALTTAGKMSASRDLTMKCLVETLTQGPTATRLRLAGLASLTAICVMTSR